MFLHVLHALRMISRDMKTEHSIHPLWLFWELVRGAAHTSPLDVNVTPFLFKYPHASLGYRAILLDGHGVVSAPEI